MLKIPMLNPGDVVIVDDKKTYRVIEDVGESLKLRAIPTQERADLVTCNRIFGKKWPECVARAAF